MVRVKLSALLLVVLFSVNYATLARAGMISWSVDADGTWGDPGNWSGGVVPGPADTVTIDRPGGDYTVTVASGSRSAAMIVSTEALVIDGGSLTVNGTVQVSNTFALQGGTLAGATVLPGTGGEGLSASNSSQNHLDGVTLEANLDLTGGGVVRIENGLVLNAAATLDNNGRMAFEGGQQALSGTGSVTLGPSGTPRLVFDGTGSLTVGPQITVSGQGVVGGAYYVAGTDSLINHGTILADAGAGETLEIQADWFRNERTVRSLSGSTLRVSSQSWTNADSLNADAAVLDLRGAWVNTGVIRFVSGSTLMLGGTFARADVGALDRSASTAKLVGDLDNTGGTLDLDGSGLAPLLVAGGRITGGTVTASLGSDLVFNSSSSNFLDGVTAETDLDLTGGGVVRIENGLVLNAAATLDNNGRMAFEGGQQELGGSGSVTLGPSGTSRLVFDGTGSLTVGPQMTVAGKGVVGGAYYIGGTDTLVVQGAIVADGSGTLTLQADHVLNQGTVEAPAGNTLRLSMPWVNQGRISMAAGGSLELTGATGANQDTIAVDGSTLVMGGDWTNAGAITVLNGSTWELGGVFTEGDLGTFDRTGSAVHLTGDLDNTGGTLDLDGSGLAPLLVAGGRITGGTVTASLGSDLVFNSSSSNFLDGVTAETDLDLTGGGVVRIENGLVLNAAATLDNNGRMAFEGGQQALSGTGSVTLGPSGTPRLVFDGTGSLTVGPQVTVAGKGVVGGAYYVGGTDTLVVQGTIVADGSGTLTLQADHVLNQGTVEAPAGNTLRLSTPWVNQGRISMAAGGSLELTGATGANQDTIAVDGSTLVMGGDWTNAGAITVLNGSTWELGGVFTEGDLGTFDRTGSAVHLTGELVNTGGTLDLDGSGLAPMLVDGGRITGGTVTASLGSDLVFSNRSTNFLDGVTAETDLDLSGGGVVRIENGLVLNSAATLDQSGRMAFEGGQQVLGGTGSVTLGPSGTSRLAFDGTGSLTVGPQVTVAGKGVVGGAYYVGGTDTLVVQGTIVADGSGILTVEPDHFRNEGTVTAVPGATLKSTPVYRQTAGSTTVDSTAVFEVPAGVSLEGGLLQGKGTVDGNIAVAGGTVRPGASVGTLTGTGDYTQAADGVLALELAGPAAYDRLVLSGTAALAGTLQVTTLGGFTASLGDTFRVSDHVASSGGFDAVEAPALDPGLIWVVKRDPVHTYLLVDTNTPPVARCRSGLFRVGDIDSCSASVTPAEVDSASYDPDGDPFTLALEPPGPYPVGSTPVMLIVTDQPGYSDTCETVITVSTGRPTARAVDRYTVVTDSADCSAAVDAALLDDGSTDPEGQPLTFSLDPPGPYPLGVTLVNFIATDGCEADTVKRIYLIVQCTRVGVDDPPVRLTLGPPRPNPAPGAVRVDLALPGAMPVEVSVFDVAGRRVRTLVAGNEGPGDLHLVWDRRDADGRRAPAGLYFLRMRAGTEVRVRKVVLTR